MNELLKIEGMTCGGCVSGVKKALATLPIANARVEIGTAEVEYDESQVTHSQLVKAIHAAGYKVVEKPPVVSLSD